MQVIVYGSLAYDRIMNFPGYFSEYILPEKVHVLNVCFQVDGMKEKFGGTAGNIAYALALMGENPVVSATIGSDYQRYFEFNQQAFEILVACAKDRRSDQVLISILLIDLGWIIMFLNDQLPFGILLP